MAVALTFVIAMPATMAQEKAAVVSELEQPSEVATRLRVAIDMNSSAVVAVKVRRSNASGVIISADGEVLTAAHVAANLKDGKTTITLADGTKREAKLIGLIHEADIALLKMEAGDEVFPFSEMVMKIPAIGQFCFAYSHPGGLKKGRPAQVRLGRIRAKRVDEGVANLIFSDANIQPGDSGGALFDLSGKLIGLTSTAGDINTNRYASVEVFHKFAKRLRAGEKIGTAPKRSKKPGKYLKLTKETLKLGRALFMKRMADKHHPTLAIVQAKAKAGGSKQLKLTEAMIAKIIGPDASTLQQTGEVGYGMDDPALLAKLPVLPDETVKRLPLMAGAKQIGYGLPISENEVLVKWSLISKVDAGELLIRQGKQKFTVLLAGKDKKWDLAILKCDKNTQFKSVKWSEASPKVKAGTLFIARDEYLVTSWGVACDSARPIRKERFTGAMMQPEKISVQCGPYDNVIRHTLPLFAADASAPIYNFDGELVAVHIARISRSTGIAIAVNDLQALLIKIRKDHTDAQSNDKFE